MISIIVPFYNEEGSLPTLSEELLRVLEKIKENWEIIFVDDGSTDFGSVQISRGGQEKLKIITHRKRLGKGKALLTGFNNSKGDIIVFMDADLQNEPRDLPNFIKKVQEGYELVNGWRRERHDSLLKTLPSSIFNALMLKLLLHSDFHDINCGFKAMRREVLDTIPLYGDNYRFLPLIARQEGFKTTEIPVHHSPRKFGRSKYGFWRLLSGLFDTITTYFVYKFSEKPLHFFGPIGGVFFLIGFIINLHLAISRIFFHTMLYRRPLLWFGILLIIVGIQVVMTGIVAELIVFLNKKR